MRVTLIGGEMEGSFLARELREAGHVVNVIEEPHQHAQSLAEESNVLVLLTCS